MVVVVVVVVVVLQCAIVDCGSGDPPGSRLVLLDAVIVISP